MLLPCDGLRSARGHVCILCSSMVHTYCTYIHVICEYGGIAASSIHVCSFLLYDSSMYIWTSIGKAILHICMYVHMYSFAKKYGLYMYVHVHLHMCIYLNIWTVMGCFSQYKNNIYIIISTSRYGTSFRDQSVYLDCHKKRCF